MSRKFTFSNFYLIFGGILLVLLLALGLSLSLLHRLPSLEKNLSGTLLDDEERISSQKNLQFLLLNSNSLLAISNPSNPGPQVIKKMRVVVTGYSSTEDQTDSEPFITAAGTLVKDGVIANNFFSFGTKIKIPEIYGDKIFVVEDRMSWEKSNYHFDIWFPSYRQAKNFGAKKTYIEILEG